MKKPALPYLEKTIREIAETAQLLWDKGWAERNAGNISVNVSRFLLPGNTEVFAEDWVDIPIECPYLKGETLLVTSTGSRMRDLAKDPLKHVCILSVDESGTRMRQWFGKGREPSSELPTHLRVHDMLIRTGSSAKCLVHAHVTELIALTHISSYCSSASINRLLWSMHPETRMFIPEGLEFLPYEVPGSSDIAEITATALEHSRVALWEKHGVLCTGASIPETFDNIDLLAKAARIYFMVKGAGFEPEGLMSW
jgi:rhamnulose-1-phosphate aldolase